MNTSTLLQNQLLATKFYVPVTSGALIARPRLSALLTDGLKHPLTSSRFLLASAKPPSSLPPFMYDCQACWLPLPIFATQSYRL